MPMAGPAPAGHTATLAGARRTRFRRRFMTDLPPPDRTVSPARQRFLLSAAVWIFVIAALAVLMLPIALPRPIRLAIAAIDLVAAAIIWLLARQRFGPRRD